MKRIIASILTLTISVVLVGCSTQEVEDTINGVISIVDAINEIAEGESVESTESHIEITEDAKYYSNHEIKDLISSIEINHNKEFTEYNREDYESPARKFECSIDGEKESIRYYTIDISPYTKDGLKDENSTFEYIDPYTGKTIVDAKNLDYDHIIPLAYAHQNGLYDDDLQKKNDYAFDISVGIPCSASENRSKGAKGPSEYLPEVNQEEYCLSWLVIANEYDLTLFEEDYEIIVDILENADNITIINNYIN